MADIIPPHQFRPWATLMSLFPNDVKRRALRRMGIAIERAIVSKAPEEKDRAAGWAGAWGLFCDIERPRPKVEPRRSGLE